MDHALGQVQPGLGEADEFHRPGCRVGHHKARRVGHPNVLAGQNDEATGDEPGVLAGFEHAGQPVEPGVGVGSPDALDEGADHIVVIVASVSDGLSAQRCFGVGQGDPPVSPILGQGDGHLQAGQGLPAVPGHPVG